MKDEGIKVLDQHFSEDERLWSLVARKSRKYIQETAKIGEETLEQILTSLITTF